MEVIGLCNVPVVAKMGEAETLGVPQTDLIYKFAGVNHFHWHKVADKKGHDLTPQLIDKLYEENSGLPKNIFDVPFYREQLQQMNMIPCGYHRYYYRAEEMLKHGLTEYATEDTRAQQVKAIEHELFELYKDPDLDYKPKQLEQRGGLIIQMQPVKRLRRSMRIRIQKLWFQREITGQSLICQRIVRLK